MPPAAWPGADAGRPVECRTTAEHGGCRAMWRAVEWTDNVAQYLPSHERPPPAYCREMAHALVRQQATFSPRCRAHSRRWQREKYSPSTKPRLGDEGDSIYGSTRATRASHAGHRTQNRAARCRVRSSRDMETATRGSYWRPSVHGQVVRMASCYLMPMPRHGIDVHTIRARNDHDVGLGYRASLPKSDLPERGCRRGRARSASWAVPTV